MLPGAHGGIWSWEGDAVLKARHDPTPQQKIRRLRRSPAWKDPRYLNDPYWVLRGHGFAHAYAKRVFRDEPPVLEHQAVQNRGIYISIDAEELLFSDEELAKIKVAIRPALSETVVSHLPPRHCEYTVWHQSIVGFGVRVRASGIKSYICHYREPGCRRSKKETLGRVGEISYGEAVRKARVVLRVSKQPHALDEPGVLDGYPHATPAQEQSEESLREEDEVAL